MGAVDALCISLDEVTQQLEDEAVAMFEIAWNDLLKSAKAELTRLAPSLS